jgi:hypothetical protein
MLAPPRSQGEAVLSLGMLNPTPRAQEDPLPAIRQKKRCSKHQAAITKQLAGL